MDIYIIIGELDDRYYHGDEKLTYHTHDKEDSALDTAVAYANGSITKGSKRYVLSSIIKFNAITLKAEKIVLELSNGKFNLRPMIQNEVASERKELANFETWQKTK